MNDSIPKVDEGFTIEILSAAIGLDFLDALKAEDELGAVIRAQILIEKKLNTLIEHYIVDAKAWKSINPAFKNKVKIAEAFFLNSDIAKPLCKLADLRNDFAHEEGDHLTKQRVNELFNSLSPSMQKLVRDCHEKTIKRITSTQRVVSSFSKQFNQLNPQSKFALIAIVIMANLASLIVEAELDKENQ